METIAFILGRRDVKVFLSAIASSLKGQQYFFTDCVESVF